MKPIPFSPPRIDEKTIEAVTEVLRSGWITTGPKTRELEKRIAAYTESDSCLCLNSWTNAAELALRWFGIGVGDEVIVPAYTYAASANIIVHCGATPVFVDCAPDSFLLDLHKVFDAITPRTKAIIPVDIGGLPVNYRELMARIENEFVRNQFVPANDAQRMLGRPLVLSDAAHSFGAVSNGRKCNGDIACFSFHAVKNLTTAEGGALIFQLPKPFDNAEVRQKINVSALHGQTKDALAKTQAGQWRYDIVEAGYKCNMTDILAAIGLTELDRYEETMERRKAIVERYNQHFENDDDLILPVARYGNTESSYHLYALRIKGISEIERDLLITEMANDQISVNVHFQPLPLLSFYRNLGFEMANYPHAYAQYANEISLPVYFDLSDDDVDRIAESLLRHIESVKAKQ